jgi:Ca2+-binding RTX toxin-like protein
MTLSTVHQQPAMTLSLREDGDIILAGSGNDHVFGQANDDQICGGIGNDILSVGGGNDKFIFNTALNSSTNLNRIQDFTASANDKIGLDDAIFSGFVWADGYHPRSVRCQWRRHCSRDWRTNHLQN